MGNVIEFIKYHLRMTKFSLPSSIRIIDIIQILLIAIFVYYLMVWIKEYQSVYTVKGCSDCQYFSDYCSCFTDGYNFMDLSTAECGCDHRRADYFSA